MVNQVRAAENAADLAHPSDIVTRDPAVAAVTSNEMHGMVSVMLLDSVCKYIRCLRLSFALKCPELPSRVRSSTGRRLPKSEFQFASLIRPQSIIDAPCCAHRSTSSQSQPQSFSRSQTRRQTDSDRRIVSISCNSSSIRPFACSRL